MGGPRFDDTVEGRGNIGVRGRAGNAQFDPGIRNAGVVGASDTGDGVQGYSSSSSSGVYGKNTGSGAGVYGHGNTGDGVFGSGNIGVRGGAGNVRFDPGIRNAGVVGASDTGDGVQGYSSSSGKSGVYAKNTGGGFAAYLDGNVRITGTLEKPSGSFRIDHPLDPVNKYLSHSFVESPDMKNVYDGVVTLDDKGEAEIELPDWFGALNKDFRYQLTAIGAPGPNLYISEEIPDASTTTRNYSRTRSSNNSNKNKNNNGSRFKIAGGASGMKVSWQVTGIRMDPWANAHRIPVEEDKPAKERGYYTYPELYGQPEEKGISHLLVPEIRETAAAHK
jgi:hypothetical protein